MAWNIPCSGEVDIVFTPTHVWQCEGEVDTVSTPTQVWQCEGGPHPGQLHPGVWCGAEGGQLEREGSLRARQKEDPEGCNGTPNPSDWTTRHSDVLKIFGWCVEGSECRLIEPLMHQWLMRGVLCHFHLQTDIFWWIH